MIRAFAILKPLIPYAMVAIGVLTLMFPLFQKVKSERNEAEKKVILLSDSLAVSRHETLEIQLLLSELKNRDNEIAANYEKAMNRQFIRMDSIRRRVVEMTLQKQKEFLTQRISAVPRLVVQELPFVQRYTTPISYWRAGERDPEKEGLTCYDAESVAGFATAVAERDEFKLTDSLKTRAVEQIRYQYQEYRTAVNHIADYPPFRRKGKALRKLEKVSIRAEDL